MCPRLVVLIKGRKDGKVAVKKTVTRKGATFQQTFWVSPAEAAALKKEQAAPKKASPKKAAPKKAAPKKAAPKKAAPKKAAPKKAAPKKATMKQASTKPQETEKKAVSSIPRRKESGKVLEWLVSNHWRRMQFAADATPKDITSLLERGVDVNDKDEYGFTMLHRVASYNDDPEVIKTLLDAGADLDARDETLPQSTPLQLAARWTNNPEVLTALLNAGADVNYRDKEGNTAWDVSQFNSSVMDTDAYRRLKLASGKSSPGKKANTKKKSTYDDRLSSVMTRIDRKRKKGDYNRNLDVLYDTLRAIQIDRKRNKQRGGSEYQLAKLKRIETLIERLDRLG